MENRSILKLIADYLRQYRFYGIMTVIFAAVFALVFYLYDLKFEAVLYALVICAVIGLAVLIINFINFAVKRKKRMLFMYNISITDESLPEPKNLVYINSKPNK